MSDESERTPPAGTTPHVLDRFQVGATTSRQIERGLDRGQRVAVGVMGGLVLAGGLLVLFAPRHAELPRAGNIATVTTTEPSAAPAPKEADAAPPFAAPVDAGAPFIKVWRVVTMKSDPGIEIIEGSFKRSLSTALVQAGVARTEIKRLARAFDGTLRIDRPERKNSSAAPKEDHTPKESFLLARDRSNGSIVAFEFIASPVDVWQARIDENTKRLNTKKLDLHVEHRRIASAIVIGTDVGKAVAAAGLREEAIEAIDDALEGHIDLTALKSGVRIRVIGTEDWVEGEFARYRVSALEFVPRSGVTLRIYGYENEGTRRRPARLAFYDARGQRPYRGTFRSPLPFARITSRFNPRRMHPVLHTILPHNGVDFGASTGTPVFAAGAGTVATVGDGGRCGNMIQIDHANGLRTGYCHLSRFVTGLHAGQHIEPRQLIGYVGKTGSATGPHLHFAVKRDGVFIDPLTLKLDGVRVLPASDRDAFVARRAELDKALDTIALPDIESAPDDKDDNDEPAGEEGEE
ncbi:MAG: M23 family metallopeptidase [Polyangiaceae bacterium]|nr:M23 family metallopeptidase [Polyangiaceae bacterium]